MPIVWMLEQGAMNKPWPGSKGAPTSKPKARAMNRSATRTLRTPTGVLHCKKLGIRSEPRVHQLGDDRKSDHDEGTRKDADNQRPEHLHRCLERQFFGALKAFRAALLGLGPQDGPD